MSLVITARWRAQPLHLGTRIPRAPLARRQRPAWWPLFLCRGLSTAPATAKPDVSTVSESSVQDQDDPAEPPTLEPENTSESNDPRRTTRPDDLTWAATSRSTFVRPAKQYSHPRETRISQRTHHKSVLAQIRHSQYVEYIQAQPVGWRHIYELLYSATDIEPLDWIDNGLKITLPRSLAREILSDAGDYTVAAIRARTKAVIAIPADDPVHTTEPSAEDASARSDLLVSGSREAINSAIDQMRRAAGKLTITRLSSPPRTEAVNETLSEDESREFNTRLRSAKLLSTPLTRAEGAPATRRWVDHHVNLTAMPSTWTTASFQDYVEDLVDSAILRHLHAQEYSWKKHKTLEDHERAVTDRLHDLFNTAPGGLVASCSALKIALRYICAKGPKYLPDALRLVENMERRGFRLDTQVFNTMLLATVKMANPSRFLALVKRMIRSGYKPDFNTWLLFLRLTQSPGHRTNILRTMRSKNLFTTPEAMQSVAREMAASDTESAIAQGMDWESFLKKQNARYGPNWLSRTTGNVVIDVLCRHGRFDDGFKMLDLMMEKRFSIHRKRTDKALGALLGTTGFNIILSHAETINKMPLAVNVQRKLSQSNATNKYFDPKPLHYLFEIAWKSRLRASIVVIWRYASLARVTTWRMRQRVADLLQGKVGNGKFEMSASAHRALGGETLARELAGGPEALARIRKLAEVMVGGCVQPWYHAKLAALAAKALPTAFSGRFPAVEPGEVLTQSTLVDSGCLRARKHGRLHDVLATAKVKTVPLVSDGIFQSRVWVGYGPRSGVRVRTLESHEPLRVPRAAEIRPADVWEDRWESGGWALLADAADGPRAASGGGLAARARDCSHMAIIDPHVWADDNDDGGGGVGNQNRTPVQIQHEMKILEALGELESQWAERRGEAARQKNLGKAAARKVRFPGGAGGVDEELAREEARDVSELEVQRDEDEDEDEDEDHDSTTTPAGEGNWEEGRL